MLHQRGLGGYVLAAGLAILALSCGMTELLQRQATITVVPTTNTETPSPTPESTRQTTETSEPTPSIDTATATVSSEPQAQLTTTATPTPTHTPQAPTATPSPTPKPTDTPMPQPTATLPGLRIESFEVDVENTGDKRIIRCTWDTTGATEVRLVIGTSQRFPPWHQGDADGNTVFELASTVYAYPEVTLTAYGEFGGEAIESITLDWPCDFTYFFAGSGVDIPRNCPSAEAAERQGARQPFQGGSAIWIPDIEGLDVIYILYSDGGWDRFEDTWDESQPESDPSIVPPAGLYQPIRGFGKVWRGNPRVQSGLNWATAHESAAPITFQRQRQESLGGVVFIQIDGEPVVRLTGLGGSGSTWTRLP